MKKKILIRADGNETIGLGHLTRCFALAEMLSADFEIIFCSIHIPKSLFNDITSKGFKVHSLKNNEEFIDILTGREIIILDHYSLDSDFQKRIKSKGNKLICIDDIFDKEFYADLIINHAPGISKEFYKSQSYTKFAIGLDYALLRSPFLEVAQEKFFSKKEKSVFICFGGSDIQNLTLRALKILIKDPRFTEINAVIGASYNHTEDLKLFSEKHKNIKLHQSLNAKEMISLMKKSELAIVPCSGILLEALALRLTLIAGTYVDNQKVLYEGAKKANLIIDAKKFSEDELKDAIEVFFKFPNKDKEPVIDGFSAKRFKSILFKYSVNLRKVNDKDALLLFDWANDPDVRKNALNSNEIELENHKNWFSKKINDPNNTEIYILEKDGRPLGQVRFDKIDGIWEIDYSIDKQYRGLGLGGRIIELGIEELKKDVKAIVKIENLSSCKVFENLGFKNENTSDGNINVYIKKWKKRS